MAAEVIVLIAEDEPIILMMMQDALESGGYTVLTATNGTDAMGLLESRHPDLSGLITDIRLGNGPDGWELGHRGRELKPDIAVVYVTGDSAHQWPAQGVAQSVVIQKPFVEAQLLTAISNLLIEGGTRA
jgi:CheY-like chemotaxis protein